MSLLHVSHILTIMPACHIVSQTCTSSCGVVQELLYIRIIYIVAVHDSAILVSICCLYFFCGVQFIFCRIHLCNRNHQSLSVCCCQQAAVSLGDIVCRQHDRSILGVDLFIAVQIADHVKIILLTGIAADLIVLYKFERGVFYSYFCVTGSIESYQSAVILGIVQRCTSDNNLAAVLCS